VKNLRFELQSIHAIIFISIELSSWKSGGYWLQNNADGIHSSVQLEKEIKAMFGLVGWDGMKWNKVMFHCLVCKKHDGMEWNPMVSIPSYSIIYTHFCSPLRLCLDWWRVMEWNGIEPHSIVWFYKKWMEWNGMWWNSFHPIPLI